MSPYFEGNVYLIRAIVILIYVIALTHFLLSNCCLIVQRRFARPFAVCSFMPARNRPQLSSFGGS